MLRDSFSYTETVCRSVTDRLAHLPMPKAIRVPALWQLRALRREVACGVAALFVIAAYLLLLRQRAATRPLPGDPGFVPDGTSFEDEGKKRGEWCETNRETEEYFTYCVHKGPVGLSDAEFERMQREKKKQEEIYAKDPLRKVYDAPAPPDPERRAEIIKTPALPDVCAQNRPADNARACGFLLDTAICLTSPSEGAPLYLVEPVITHREQPVDVLEPQPDGCAPRRVTRYRKITVLYRNAQDKSERAFLSNAFCVQQLVEALERGWPDCRP